MHIYICIYIYIHMHVYMYMHAHSYTMVQVYQGRPLQDATCTPTKNIQSCKSELLRAEQSQSKVSFSQKSSSSETSACYRANTKPASAEEGLAAVMAMTVHHELRRQPRGLAGLGVASRLASVPNGPVTG